MNEESRMGRPRQSDEERQQKIDAIIQAAQALFIAEGFPSVSMRKIAAKAGMGTMTLYQYFPSRNAILHHIWADFFRELFARVRAEVETQEGARNKLKQACMTYLNYWIEHQDRFRIVFLNEDRASSPDGFFINHANIAEEMLIFVGPLMQELMTEIDQSKVIIFLESLMCLVNGIALNVITISEFPWSHHEQFIDMFLDSTLSSAGGA